MDLQHILIILAFGAVAGWIASLIFRGSGYGLIGDIIIGILGSFIGSLILVYTNLNEKFTLNPGWLRQLIVAVAGGIILLTVVKLIFPGKK
ncbi:MAG: GlsB/YeaQ/YmgE family stress response membrane protein [Chitinophagaceae bacterium]